MESGETFQGAQAPAESQNIRGSQTECPVKFDRRHPCYATAVSIRFSTHGDAWKEGMARRISAVSLCLESMNLLSVGAPLTMEIPFLHHVDDKSKVRISGKIAAKTGSSPFVYGVVFNDMEEELRAHIIELISQLLMDGKATSISVASGG